MLLSDKPTADFLSENVVCAWREIRPVPQVTIDFGDGKVMRRTLAGNTILILSLPDGTVVDAYPGVYEPEAFRAELTPGLKAARDAIALPVEARSAFLREWHRTQVRATADEAARATTMSKSGIESPILAALRRASTEAAPPVATTLAKAMVEAPVLRSMSLATPASAAMDGSALDAYAAHLVDVSKRPASSDELRASLGLPNTASGEEVAKRLVTMDSATNVRWVRPAVRMLLAQFEKPSVASISETIYRRILHLEIDDPYLGLRDVLMPGTP